MNVKINNLNKYTPIMIKGTRRFFAGMERSDILAPIILLESTVVTGRTYHAYKRGGFIEGRERFTEEILGSIFWLFGFKMFNNIGDKIGKKLLGLKNVNFDVEEGKARRPLENFVKKHANISQKKIATFKCSKVVASILLSNMIIGFVVPKINQAITRQYQKSTDNVNTRHPELYQKGKSFDQFINKNKSNEKHNSKPSFGFGAADGFAVANLFESNATAQLLSNDVGTAGGRAINARNKHERTEILFRDITSIYFYMFCRHHINSLFNKVESGRTTRLNTLSTETLHNHIVKSAFKNGKEEYFGEEFRRKILGDENASIPGEIDSNFENEIMNLEKFEKIAEKHPNLVPEDVLKRARKMALLQPELDGQRILTRKEVLDSFAGGEINNPNFLHKAFRRHFGDSDNNLAGNVDKGTKTSFQKLRNKVSSYKFDDPYSYIDESKIAKLHEQMKDYVKDISQKAISKGERINLNTVKKANHMNFALNAFNLGFGFVVASYFLSTAIPKIQYWITKVTTGQDQFPGTTQYQDAKNKKVKNK